MELKITQATETDIQLIISMAEVTFRHTYRDILTAEQIEYMMEWMYSAKSLEKQLLNGHRFFIATNKDVPCGYMSIQKEGITDDGITTYHLHKLYVLPEKQYNGIGNLLFDHAFQYAAQDKNTPEARIELNVNRSNKAIGFYLRKGMKIVSEGDFPIGSGYYMNDYIMSLEL